MEAAVKETVQNGLWRQMIRAYRWCQIALGFAAVLFVMVLLGQSIWLVRTTSEVHPWLGGIVAASLLAAAAVLVGVPAVRYWRTPRVIEPPQVAVGRAVKPADLRRTIWFLDRVLLSGLANKELAATHEKIPPARSELLEFGRRTRKLAAAQAPAMDGELAAWAERTLPAIWKPVEQKVERLIYHEAVTVGVATALSPNGTLDAYVMLWRSTHLVSQIATLYYGRPGLLGTAAVCRDVAVATAVAGYIQSVTESLGNIVLHSIGGATGFVAGPAMEGVTNALVLTRIGYLAQARCRSYRPWNSATQKSALLGAISATRRVAVGLSTEILRKAGVGLGAAAGLAASTAAAAAGSAAEKIGAAAQAAAGWGASVSRIFSGSKPLGSK